jgi:hypothetical protein
MDTVLRSVERTSHALIVHRAVRQGGLGAEIAARIQERRSTGSTRRCTASARRSRRCRQARCSSRPSCQCQDHRCGSRTDARPRADIKQSEFIREETSLTQAQSYPVETKRKFLEQMLTIRRAEEQVIHFATDHKDLIRGHFHVYIGQEASGVGACAALGPDDYVFTTHRNHGHVIARGGELKPVLAEIIGRTTGYNKGRGGTFHVIAPHLGILQTSGVVGGCVPLAAGAAFSIKKRGTKQVSLVFFGDGVSGRRVLRGGQPRLAVEAARRLRMREQRRGA